MAVKIAINGFGRIGRLAFRLMFGNEDFDIVAINDLTGCWRLSIFIKIWYCTRSLVGHDVKATQGSIIVDGKEIKIYAIKDANDGPWGELV